MPRRRILLAVGIIAIILVVSIFVLLQTPILTPISTPQWHRVIVFTGSGSTSKTTESFYIPSDKWRIVWEHTSDPNYPQHSTFAVLIFREGEKTYTESIVHTGESTEDMTYIYRGRGNFYLKILTANTPEWTIAIEAYY